MVKTKHKDHHRPAKAEIGAELGKMLLPSSAQALRQNYTFLSKAKLLGLMIRPTKYLHLVVGVVKPYFSHLGI